MAVQTVSGKADKAGKGKVYKKTVAPKILMHYDIIVKILSGAADDKKTPQKK